MSHVISFRRANQHRYEQASPSRRFRVRILAAAPIPLYYIVNIGQNGGTYFEYVDLELK
ncbi:MAG: hypothetical protein QXN51_05660 [Ignisphaera sp.]